MAGINFAGEFKVEQCVLHTSSGNKTDISKLIISVDLFENIFEKQMSGSIMINDTNALDLNLPVTGHDYVTLKITTPGLDGAGQNIDFTNSPLIVYRIGTKQEMGGKANMTEISVITKDALRNQRIRVSSSYTGTCSEIAEKVLRDEIRTKRDLFIEPSMGIRNVVVPNRRPYDFLQRLAGETISQEDNSPHYLFYENTKGIHFRSLQSMYSQDIKQSFFSAEAGTQNNANDSKQPNIEKELKRVTSFEQGAISDTVTSYRNGMMAGTLIQHDIFQKKYNKQTFNYIDDFKKHKRINGSSSKDNPIFPDSKIDGDNKISDFPDARIMITPISAHPNDINIDASYIQEGAKYGEGFLYSNDRSHDSALARKSKLMELNQGASVNLQVVGQTHLSCGDIVEFDMPIQGRNHTGEEINPYYKGRYLITTLRHTFSNMSNSHSILMRLAKDSFESPIKIVGEVDDFETGRQGLVSKQFYT
jgi:hypothetical protein